MKVKLRIFQLEKLSWNNQKSLRKWSETELN